MYGSDMATNTVQITGLPVFGADYAAGLAEHVRRYVAGNGTVADVVAVAQRTAPGAPTSPAGTSAAAHSVITWVAPTTGSAVTHYKIDIRKSSDDSLLRTDYADGSLLTFDVLGLAANTAYAIVTAVNEVGAGTPSAHSANFTVS